MREENIILKLITNWVDVVFKQVVDGPNPLLKVHVKWKSENGHWNDKRNAADGWAERWKDWVR